MWRIICCVCCVACLLCFCFGAAAQEQRPLGQTGSELGRENMSRVAASAGQIKAVLVKDSGLLVELKRWVAKDATDHGQVVSDGDLTNDAIFERLEMDVQFRSVATVLVQRYGYLVPKLNPDSAQAKERELLVVERTKWLAQDQEKEREQARRQSGRNLQNAGACNGPYDAGCEPRETERAGAEGVEGEFEPGSPQPRMDGEPATPNIPGGNGNPTERGQLQQTGAENSSSGSPNTLGGWPDSLQPAASMDRSQAGNYSSPMGSGGADESSKPFPAEGNAESQAAADVRMEQGAAGGWGSASSSSNAGDGGAASGREEERPAASSARDVGAGGSIEPTNRRAPPKKISPAPEMIRKRSPYNDIPSLYDMYVQAAPRPAVPQRFGAQIFENRNRNSQLIPMDLPAGPDYVVGPGDGLSIDLWGGVSQRFYRRVDREGRVSLPEVGPILVSGKSLAEVQQNLQQILRTQFRDVSADVSLARLRTIRIYEVGDVTNPGAYDVSSLSTPLNALFAAGGPTARGSLRTLNHYRGNQLVEVVDVYDLLLHGVKGDIQRLENGDTVQVPPIGAQVVVEGMVRRPAIYELRDEKNLASVLELAGGLLPTAALRHIEVERTVTHEKQTMLSVDLRSEEEAGEVTKQLETFEVHDGDRIRIFPIAPYNQDAIYLEGHVLRPGRYSFRAGMRVTDVIASYKELLPEPATGYAEIIRLNAPDFHPSVESFDLADAFANPEQAPVLKAMDTVRVFSRYDFENPPTVSVWGDVRAPGTYRTSGQIHLVDAIHLAGGLAPDAQTEDAQVFRYLPDGKMKIFSVSLSQALAGDPAENILLEARDRLLIHRNAASAEPATVYVQGEVGKPGRYPLTSNMRIADLIRVGGGLQAAADTQTADLMHFEWAGQKSQLSGQHETIALPAALAGDSAADISLHNGDVLTIRQLPGWNDLGAAIVVKGEIQHPGTYGIRPGERLSSVLKRAGGFQADAYPYGAVLQRVQVRELETKAQEQMILRVKGAQERLELLPDTDAAKKQAKETAIQQSQTSLEQLSTNPPIGRVAIRISSNISRWAGTAADVEVRAGDTLVIPKRPSFVMVTGQVFNPTAVSYRPGKSARWYLGQSGGPTALANKKGIFVIRADGSVVGSRDGLWSGNSMGAVLEPGDTVVVPERALGGGVPWQNIFLAAQTAASVASAVFIAVHY
ncbi:MAG: SLBB domain-containing protein [Candidatus Acidiferrales bacterium]